MVLALCPAAASADSGRPAQPACASTSHFVIHCDSPGSPNALVQQAVSDFEEAYGHDVVGGGLAPNAGLRPPFPDDDGKTDVYLMAPPDMPDLGGGAAYRDFSHQTGDKRSQAGFIFMTARQTRDGFRFRAAHEFMHVIQFAYTGAYVLGWQEGIANWAGHWATGIDPGADNFNQTYVPFDCTYGTWPPPSGRSCGNGYWQWLFFERQVEDFGGDFMAAFLERARSLAGASSYTLTALKDELAARTGLAPDDALSSRFGDYARRVWDPTAWTTAAVRSLFDDGVAPVRQAHSLGRVTDTGPQTVTVDHLAARYAAVDVSEPFPGNELRFTVTPPPGLVNPPDLLVGTEPGSARTVVPLTADGSGNLSATLPAGPSDPTDVVIALVNDTLATDGLQFSYRAELLGFVGLLSIARQKLGTVLRRGLQADVTCEKDCGAKVSVRVSRSTAEALGIGRELLPRRRGTVTIGTAKERVAAGAATVTVRFARRARAALRDADAVRVSVKGAFTNAEGTRRTVAESVRLKR